MSTPIPNITLALAAVLTGACAGTEPARRIGHLDRSHAFYYPDLADHPDGAIASLAGGPIDGAIYLRYLAGRFGDRYVEDLAFDIALARECERLRLVRNAPLLARSAAARRFHESGRGTGSDPLATQQRKFINEALRTMRVDALAGLRRSDDPEAVRGLFHRRFGEGGERVRVRHVLVSFRGTRRRLTSTGAKVDEAAIQAAARDRAGALRRQLEQGASFASLLASSDDRATRTLLRDPAQAQEAGVLGGYNYQRFGADFATAVRGLAEGEVSRPVPSPVGFHLIELVNRRVTKLADVLPRLRKELRRGQAKPVEVAALRRDLLAAYRFVPEPPSPSPDQPTR